MSRWPYATRRTVALVMALGIRLNRLFRCIRLSPWGGFTERPQLFYDFSAHFNVSFCAVERLNGASSLFPHPPHMVRVKKGLVNFGDQHGFIVDQYVLPRRDTVKTYWAYWRCKYRHLTRHRL